jgi:hypothetical protein
MLKMYFARAQTHQQSLLFIHTAHIRHGTFLEMHDLSLLPIAASTRKKLQSAGAS